MPRSRTIALATLLLGTLLGALALAGCSSDDSPGTPSAKPTPTNIAQVDTAAAKLVRVAFCDLVPLAAVTRALVGSATSAQSWGNGDPLPVVADHDVAHEFGCAWAGTKSRTAQTWVYARAVDAAFARRLVRSAATERGCEVRSGPAFGSPAVTQVCDLGKGVTRVRHAGLFGDTWLTCQVGGRDGAAAVRGRADAWCTAVATALDTAR